MPRPQTTKPLNVQAPRTIEDALKVHKRLSRLEGINRIKLGVPKLKRSRNRGKGNNKNYMPDPTNGWDIASTHVIRDINAEGNIAEIPVRSVMSDREWNFHQYGEDERKIRRMKNRTRKLRRKLRNRREHGRSVRVGS